MVTNTSALRRATTPLVVWSGIVVLTLLTAGWLRYSEGASGPWLFTGAVGMFSLFGVADGMGDRGVLIRRLAFASFIVVGAAWAWETAQMRNGYVAAYGFVAAWLMFLFDLVIAAGLLIRRGSRTIGKRLVIAGGCRLAAFYAVIFLTQTAGHTRWEELKGSVKVVPTQPR